MAEAKGKPFSWVEFLLMLRLEFRAAFRRAAFVFGMFALPAAFLILSVLPLIQSYQREQNEALAVSAKSQANMAAENFIARLNLENLPPELRLALIRSFSESAVTRAATIDTTLPKAEREEEVKQQIAVLEERVSQVETRFPSDTALEKYASINDAILITRLEAMEKRIDKIDEKSLNEWDIAMVFFLILGGMAAIITVLAFIWSFYKWQKLKVSD